MQSRGYGAQNSNSALNSFHSVFGNNDTGTPPLLDLSEFPSLTSARGNESMPQSNILQTPGSKPYGERECIQSVRNVDTTFLSVPVHLVGMVKQPTAEQTEFQMSSEDFPALPGTQLNDGLISSAASQQMGLNHNLGGNTSSSVSGGGGGMGGISGGGLDCGTNSLDTKNHHLTNTGTGDLQIDTNSAQDKAFKRGIQTSPDGNACTIDSIHFTHLY